MSGPETTYKEPLSERVTLRLRESKLDDLDDFVDESEYPSRAVVLREGLDRVLEEAGDDE